MKPLPICVSLLLAAASILPGEPLQISGVYPHLRMWNDEGECGTGAVVPWQGELWAITYAPHRPYGSTDKLYRITPALEQIIFEGSVGGTPANRMIHPETNQLLIGPYLIDAEKNIRVIPPAKMTGRLTGNARHLKQPEKLIYYATMEEGLYEVDLTTLEVTCLIRDGHMKEGPGVASKLPGYHGKGLYSGQGRLVYSNNGDQDPAVTKDPTVPSGALAEWFGEGDWQLVRRNQFTEVTGPGGIRGQAEAENAPLWAMGWDARSLILALLDGGKWHWFRLPKGSHSYDGAHGWNTEWPRIREIGETDLLATMHGTFWRFPAGFSLANTAGIAPRSNYLKVIGDFCQWNGRVVFGGDDSAKAEFLNVRPFKAAHGAPLQSNSNLWFVEPAAIDQFGPVIGRGSVWLREEVAAGAPSDPYLFSGYDYRQLQITHGSDGTAMFTLEVDREGKGKWETLDTLTVAAGQAVSRHFTKEESGAWIRLRADRALTGVTAHFHFRNRDHRTETNHAMFSGLAAQEGKAATTGLMRSLTHEKLGLAAFDQNGQPNGYYELDQTLTFTRVDNPAAASALAADVRQPAGTFTVDAASVLLIEDGKRYRLPKSGAYHEPAPEAKDAANDPESALSQSLAIGATVRTSSQHLKYAAAHAIDGKAGNDEARWISSGQEVPWIELDFGAPKTIGSVWVVTGWKNDVQFTAPNFDVQIPDGENWKTVAGGEVRGNQRIWRSVVFDQPVSSSRLRVMAKGGGHFRVYEVAAFAEAQEIPVPPLTPGPARICREVATERDLLNVHGTFYELPARNAQGLAKVRPVATHGLRVHDFCSHNGLLFFTGLDAESTSEHIFRSSDGKAAVWVGVIDDLWKLGKPRGQGGPWKDSAVKAGVPSDPYLMTGYDRKSVRVEANDSTTIRLEIDVDGTGLWMPYESFTVSSGSPVDHEFPAGFSAYWVRAVADRDVMASVTFTYQ